MERRGLQVVNLGGLGKKELVTTRRQRKQDGVAVGQNRNQETGMQQLLAAETSLGWEEAGNQQLFHNLHGQ